MHREPAPRGDWNTIRTLLPYLLEFKGRALVLAKLANVAVPLVLKEIVDAMNRPRVMLLVPVFLVVGY